MSNKNWGSYSAYYWPEGRRVPISHALSKRSTQNRRAGDCWCHEDCYKNGTGRKLFPRLGGRMRRDHFWVGPGSGTRTTQHPTRGLISTDGCAVSRRVKQLDEDTGSNNYYEQFYSDLKAELAGSGNMWGNIDTYHIQRVEFPKKNQRNASDLIIHHTRGRNLTHVVIVNMSSYRKRPRILYDETKGRTQFNTILIDIRQWTEDQVSDFASFGKRKFKEEWDRLNLRVQRHNQQTAEAAQAARIAEQKERDKQRELLIQSYLERLRILDDLDDYYLDGISDDALEQLFHQRQSEILHAEAKAEAQRIADEAKAELQATHAEAEVLLEDAEKAAADVAKSVSSLFEILEETGATGQRTVDAYAAAETAAEDVHTALKKTQQAAAATMVAVDVDEARRQLLETKQASDAAVNARKAARSASSSGASAATAERFNRRSICATDAIQVFDRSKGIRRAALRNEDPWSHAKKEDLPRQNLEVCRAFWKLNSTTKRAWFNGEKPVSSLWLPEWSESQKFNNTEELQNIIQDAGIELDTIIEHHNNAKRQAILQVQRDTLRILDDLDDDYLDRLSDDELEQLWSQRNLEAKEAHEKAKEKAAKKAKKDAERAAAKAAKLAEKEAAKEAEKAANLHKERRNKIARLEAAKRAKDANLASEKKNQEMFPSVSSKDSSPKKPLSVGQKIKIKKQKKKAKKTPKQPTEELTGKNRPKKPKKGRRLSTTRGGPRKKD